MDISTISDATSVYVSQLDIIIDNIWVIILSATINVGAAVNNRSKYLPYQCVLHNKNIHIALTYICSFCISMSLSVLAAICAYSLGHIWFGQNPNEQHYVNLLMAISIIFAPLLHSSLYAFINRRGIALLEKYTNMKIVKEENKSKG